MKKETREKLNEFFGSLKPILRLPKKMASYYNPDYEFYMRYFKKSYSKHSANRVTVKKLVENKVLSCNCGSDDFRDLGDSIICRGCGAVEFKNNILRGNIQNVSVKSVHFQRAVRLVALEGFLRKHFGREDACSFLERYALRKEEFLFVKLNRKLFSERKRLAGFFGVTTSQLRG